MATTALWVEAGPFRAHLQHLMAVGNLTSADVAELAGLSPRATATLLQGRNGRAVRRISRDTAQALLRLTSGQARALRSWPVPAALSRQRLQQILATGRSVPELAVSLGVSTLALDELADGSAAWCSSLLALRLTAHLRRLPGGRTEPLVPAA